MTGDDRAGATPSGQHAGHHHHHWMGPSGTGTVVLDIGGDTGALIIHTGPECYGWEIEISPAGAREGSSRQHAAVRERHLPGRVVYSVVYDGLPAGEYDIWRDATTPAGRVTVRGATVTEFHWPSA
jgi:hypothetical protein